MTDDEPQGGGWIGPLFARRPQFDGATFDQAQDGQRLKAQLAKVRAMMLRGGWYTLEQLSTDLGYPQASISARLRDLRKLKFGGYNVERRRVQGGRGLHEYKLGSSA